MVAVKTEDKLQLPSFPKGLPLIGNLNQLRKMRHGFYTYYSQLYNGAFGFEILGARFLVLSDPDYIEQVLVSQRENFVKGSAFNALRARFGNGILFSDGDYWVQQRRLIQPAFHRSRIETYHEIMVDLTDKMLKSWQTSQVSDIYPLMIDLSFKILTGTLFENEITTETIALKEAVRNMVEQFEARRNQIFKVPLRVKTPANRRYEEAFTKVDQTIYQLINQIRKRQSQAETYSGGSILAMLFEAQDETGAKLNDLQIHDELLTMFFAGHETTALALTWTFYLLASHPDVQKQLTAEVERVLGTKKTLELNDLTKLEYSNQVLKEVLRLYPPAWVLARNAVKSCKIGKYDIPAGTSVVVMPWVAHRNPVYYSEPETFRPERWTEEFSHGLPRFAYFPFGGGPRQCLGSSFANLEMLVVLSLVTRHYNFQLPNLKQKIIPDGSISLRPKEGIKLLMTKKEGKPEGASLIERT